jgi:transglutaminase superfamily protein
MSRADVASGPAGAASLRDRAALVAEVLVTYGQVRWSVRRRDLPAVVATLRAPRRRHAPCGPLDADDRRLAAAAVRVLARLPGDSRCLTRSLVVLAMLARRGVGVRLILAARPSPTFSAHAWVERSGRPLLPTRDFDDARLAEL